jgi:hypothetical protein
MSEELLLAEIRSLSVRCCEVQQQSNAALNRIRGSTSRELDKMSAYVANGGNDPAVILRLIERAKSRLV